MKKKLTIITLWLLSAASAQIAYKPLQRQVDSGMYDCSMACKNLTAAQCQMLKITNSKACSPVYMTEEYCRPGDYQFGKSIRYNKDIPALAAAAKENNLMCLDLTTPIDVPAVERAKRWICEDKKRLLLTDENGGRHCVRFSAE